MCVSSESWMRMRCIKNEGTYRLATIIEYHPTSEDCIHNAQTASTNPPPAHDRRRQDIYLPLQDFPRGPGKRVRMVAASSVGAPRPTSATGKNTQPSKECRGRRIVAGDLLPPPPSACTACTGRPDRRIRIIMAHFATADDSSDGLLALRYHSSSTRHIKKNVPWCYHACSRRSSCYPVILLFCYSVILLSRMLRPYHSSDDSPHCLASFLPDLLPCSFRAAACFPQTAICHLSAPPPSCSPSSHKVVLESASHSLCVFIDLDSFDR